MRWDEIGEGLEGMEGAEWNGMECSVPDSVDVAVDLWGFEM